MDSVPEFPVRYRTDPEGFHPFLRDPETLTRPWAIPGTPGLEHRIGGIEKDYDSGNISYDADNHQRMTNVRAERMQRVAANVPPQTVSSGPGSGRLVVVGWGSTFGAINQAVHEALEQGEEVSHIHIRHLYPFPENLGDLLAGFDKIIVPEMNAGQLVVLLRSQYLVPAVGVNQVTGKPFKISEIRTTITHALES